MQRFRLENHCRILERLKPGRCHWVDCPQGVIKNGSTSHFTRLLNLSIFLLHLSAFDMS